MFSLVIITGLSGAGKSTAAKALEDQGYYIIDNMPAIFVEKFVNIFFDLGINASKIALVLDIRSGNSKTIYSTIRFLQKKNSAKVIFLKATDESLLKRYNESRRKHPVGKDVAESISEEREQLADIESISDMIIDTTGMTVHELVNELNDVFSHGVRNMQITLYSFGFKHGIPAESDMVFDIRFIKNPHFIDSMRYKTGKEKDVSDYVFSDPNAQEFFTQLSNMVLYLIPLYIKEGKHYLTLSIGCTGGHHRSVAFIEKLHKLLLDNDINSHVKHRDISR